MKLFIGVSDCRLFCCIDIDSLYNQHRVSPADDHINTNSVFNESNMKTMTQRHVKRPAL